ncbi:MAG: hypothetical protein HQM04_08420 [Magnetococcales bacterium]|nr:hypothetical protein [Magnetococcales bacterium]MBF0115056.1 hypothetical protein [Magnetococcales bacterium]
MKATNLIALTLASLMALSPLALQAGNGLELGALGGALVGSMAGPAHNRLGNAVLGAVVGGVVGQLIDDADGGSRAYRHHRPAYARGWNNAPRYVTTRYVEPVAVYAQPVVVTTIVPAPRHHHRHHGYRW